MPSDARPLIGFLAASLLLHAALLGWLHPSFHGAASGVADVAHLDISLLHAPFRHREPESEAPAAGTSPRTPAQPPAEHRSPAHRKPTHSARPTAPTRSHRTAQRATTQPPAKHPSARTHQAPAHQADSGRPHVHPGTKHPAGAAATPSSASPRASVHQNAARRGTLTRRLRKALVQGLQRYFHYPPLARARGWQGKVVLSLRINGNGKISRLKVARSSGYPVLDRAALRSLKQVRRLPQAAAWLHGQDVEMELPVRYQLVGS